MKQTAVEWFAERIQSDKIFNFENVLKQAIEMEKQQIINASNESFMNGGLVKRRVKNKKVFSVGEQYYNETFKSK